jgi:hypothetical protein
MGVGSEAFSVRAASRHYGISTVVLAREIRLGRLRAARLAPKRYLILRQDLEAWLDSLAIIPSVGREGGGLENLSRSPAVEQGLRGALRRVHALAEQALEGQR